MVISFESRKKSFPAYSLPLVFAGFAFLFPDRWNYCLSILLALILFLGSYSLGKHLSFLLFKSADQTLYFPFGLGIVLGVVYAAAQYTTGPLLWYSLWASLGVLSMFELPVLTYRFNRAYLWAAPFALVGLWSALTPATYSDTLSSHLGLAHQYLAMGRVNVLQRQLFSSFPPFGYVLDLIFAGVNAESGIKLFLILTYFQIVSILVALLRWLLTEPAIEGGNGRDREYQLDFLYMSRMEWIVLPMLFLPMVWILIHWMVPDLIASLFFCAGVAALVREFDLLSFRKVLYLACLFAMAIWTKYAIVLYVMLLPVLWLSLSRWKFSAANWKILITLLAVILFIWVPFLIRNFITLGDPFYPFLSGILKDHDWSAAQSLALEQDFLAEKGAGWKDVFLTPLQMVFHTDRLGPAAGAGIVSLVALCLYPFARKLRSVNQILVYLFFCYLAWVLTFREFQTFLPPFLLFHLVCYFSFRHLYIRSSRYLIAVLFLCGVVSAYGLIPIYASFPLIRPGQNRQEYLSNRLDYYLIAEQHTRQSATGKVLMIGETRTAYWKASLIVSSPYDRSLIWSELRKAQNVADLRERLKREDVRYILFAQKQFQKMFMGEGLWQLPSSKIDLLKGLLAESRLVDREGDIALYEMGSSDAG